MVRERAQGVRKCRVWLDSSSLGENSGYEEEEEKLPLSAYTAFSQVRESTRHEGKNRSTKEDSRPLGRHNDQCTDV